MFDSDTRDVAATWFDLWNRNIFLNRPVHFDLQVTVELRGTETGQVTFKSGLFIRSTEIYEVRFHAILCVILFSLFRMSFFLQSAIFVNMNITLFTRLVLQIEYYGFEYGISASEMNRMLSTGTHTFNMADRNLPFTLPNALPLVRKYDVELDC